MANTALYVLHSSASLAGRLARLLFSAACRQCQPSLLSSLRCRGLPQTAARRGVVGTPLPSVQPSDRCGPGLRTLAASCAIASLFSRSREKGD